MDDSEKLCLKWSDFQENLTSSFALLRNDKEFTDVTLVCEDGQQIETHKVVLAASSTFFMELLKRNKHLHPMVYMRGVKSHEILAILDFIYCGVANVFKVNLEEFLTLAEDLKLKSLTENELRNNDSMKSNVLKREKSKTYFEDESHMSKLSRTFQDDSDSLISQESPVAISKQTTTSNELDHPDEQVRSVMEDTELQHDSDTFISQESSVVLSNQIAPNIELSLDRLDEQVRSMMEDSGNMILVGKAPRKAKICKVCGKEGNPTAIKDHIEANHLDGVSLPCNYCEKTFRSRMRKRQHNCKADILRN